MSEKLNDYLDTAAFAASTGNTDLQVEITRLLLTVGGCSIREAIEFVFQNKKPKGINLEKVAKALEGDLLRKKEEVRIANAPTPSHEDLLGEVHLILHEHKTIKGTYE